MFQTSHPWASYHAAARCISGGPITITDTPGQHDTHLIEQITAKTIRGQTVILRPDLAGKTTQQYIGYDEGPLLKISTYVGRRRTGMSILGAFNISDRPVTDFLTLDDFPGTLPREEEYVIRAHSSGDMTQPTATSSPILALTLKIKEWEILTAFPLISFHTPTTTTSIKMASLGLVNKMTSAAAILRTEYIHEPRNLIDKQQLKIKSSTTLKALGTLGTSLSHLPSSIPLKNPRTK